MKKIRTVVWGWRLTGKGHEEAFWSYDDILHLDTNLDYKGP